MKNFTLFISVVFIFFFSCEKLKKEKKTELPGKTVCVFFDLSLSTAKKEIRESYCNNLKLIMKSINHGDVIVGGLITQKSISELAFCFQYEFPKFVPSTNNPLFKKSELKQFQNRIVVVKDSLLAVADSVIMSLNARIMKTEIMSAMQVAERVFSRDKSRKVLVIMSDMIEDSPLHRFQTDNLTTQRIQTKIENERKNNMLPNLKDVNVYVLGATAKSTKKYLQIRNFWKGYFDACEATLIDYGSSLIRFSE
ncbi:hypothetical protein H8E88_12230 [candidate division KSB1 bacterium]|nr:hypothetical protein [candidate division KSB1 bacterium]